MIKLLPYPLLCVEDIENWLNKMSLDGYHLVKLNSIFATFEQGASEDVKYYLVFYNDAYVSTLDVEVLSKKSETDELTRLGWQILIKDVRYKETQLFFKPNYCSVYKSTVDEPIKDIEKDEWMKGILLKSTERTVWILNGIFSVLTLILSYPLGRILHFDFKTYTIDGLFLNLPRYFAVVVLFALYLCKFSRQNRFLKYYRGEKPAPKRPIKRRTLLTALTIVLCLSVLTFINPQKLSTSEENTYLGDIDNLVTPQAIEGEYSGDLPDELLDDYYEGYCNSALFMPLHYVLHEDTFNNKNSYGFKYTDVTYTETSFTWILDRLYDKWSKQYYFIENNVVYLNGDYFDEIKYYIDNRNGTFDMVDYKTYYFLFRGGNELLGTAYRGERTPEEVISNVEKLFIDE